MVKGMASEDKRKSPRIDSPNLLAYLCLDEEDNEIMQGMGRTLNVSEGGILLETHISIDPQYRVLLTIAMEDDLMYFRGRIAHTKKREDGKFESGVAFIDLDEEKRRFLRQYITVLRSQENTM